MDTTPKRYCNSIETNHNEWRLSKNYNKTMTICNKISCIVVKTEVLDIIEESNTSDAKHFGWQRSGG